MPVLICVDCNYRWAGIRPQGRKVANNIHILLLLSDIGVLTYRVSSTQIPSLMKLSRCVEPWIPSSSSIGEPTSWPNDNLLEGAWKRCQKEGKAGWNVIIKITPHENELDPSLSQPATLSDISNTAILLIWDLWCICWSSAPWSWWLDKPWFNLSLGPTRKHNGGFIGNDIFYWRVPESIEILIS